VAWLIDSDVSRAQALARQFDLDCQVGSDFREALPQVEALINALPNHLHTSVNLEALHAGVHVLCEKPLSITSAEARRCCEAAQKQSVLLAVGMNRRFVGSHKLLPIVLQEGTLGELVDYDWSYGGVFDWRSATGFYFSRNLAGGGALIDFGVHLLDSLTDWFGPATVSEYQDDDWGSGVEANAIVDLRHDGQMPVTGRVRLSRTYPLSNRLVIRGAKAQAEISADDSDVVTIRRKSSLWELNETMRLPGFPGATSFYRQLDNFVAGILGVEECACDGWQAVRLVELIEECYAKRRRIPEPWSEPALELDGALR
jgi:predicted dehydrogenase